MATYLVLGLFAFVLLIVCMAIIVIYTITKPHISTAKQIIEHFVPKSDTDDLDMLIAYCKNNKVDYQID